MKRILMIAYHFPPLAGSSGVQRTLRFVQHLPKFGWEPLVLTANARAYERTADDLLVEVPPQTTVRRAFALDTARHLSLAGRYPAALARPDRWQTWRLGALLTGRRMIAQFEPDVLWSTYPIATAHVIGAELARHSGLPWIADFRDPMAQPGYPADPVTWSQFQAIEQRAMEFSHLNLFTTPGAARLYRHRYPHAARRIDVVENGYDEETFANAETSDPVPLNPGAFTVLHSGIVYPSERDPRALLAAIGSLRQSAKLREKLLKIRFRAPVHEDLLRSLAAMHGIEDLIEVLPPISYQGALSEMLRADALLVLQAANCNDQIPAKIYEYMRANKPIIALTDPDGDTAQTLRMASVDAIAPLDDSTEIARLLIDLVGERIQSYYPNQQAVLDASRCGRTHSLAKHLDRLITCPPFSPR